MPNDFQDLTNIFCDGHKTMEPTKKEGNTFFILKKAIKLTKFREIIDLTDDSKLPVATVFLAHNLEDHWPHIHQMCVCHPFYYEFCFFDSHLHIVENNNMKSA